MLGHCEGICTPDTMVCALVQDSPRAIRWEEGVQSPLILMRFHGVFLGAQHEIWSKPHNRKVSYSSFVCLAASNLRDCKPSCHPMKKAMRSTTRSSSHCARMDVGSSCPTTRYSLGT